MQLVRLSKETGIPLVASNDVHYVEKDDHDVHDILYVFRQENSLMKWIGSDSQHESSI